MKTAICQHCHRRIPIIQGQLWTHYSTNFTVCTGTRTHDYYGPTIQYHSTIAEHSHNTSSTETTALESETHTMTPQLSETMAYGTKDVLDATHGQTKNPIAETAATN